MDYPGKVITKNQVTPTQTSATGVWTLDDAAAAVKNNNWPVAGVPNPISKSLRFNSADSAYLNRTPGVAGNLRTWTWSAWVKRSALGGAVVRLFNANDSGSPFLQTSLRFDTDQLRFYNDANSTADVRSSAVYRDASAWYHIVCAIDTTQATAANRVKLYVNGSQVTALATATYPNQNTDMYVNAARAHQIGSSITPSQFFDGYLTEVNFIDGQALTPSSFGMTDPQTGAWEPIRYTGTYGTNGFYLNFKDATSTTTLGYDYSGNANNWTTNNFSVTAGTGNDSLTDVPTPWIAYNTTGDVGGVVRGNYCTLNPLDSGVTVVNGNLDFVYVATNRSVLGTVGMRTGKFRWEFTPSAANNNFELLAGVIRSTSSFNKNANECRFNAGAYSVAGLYGGSTLVRPVNNNTFGTSFGWTWTNGDVLGLYFDATNGTLKANQNGGSLVTVYTGLTTGIDWLPVFSDGSISSATHVTNFGQRPFAYASAESGYQALCTQNLPTPTIGATSTTQANQYFNVLTYAGSASNQTISGLNFQPDFIWFKERTTAGIDHFLLDSVRNNYGSRLQSNTTNAEAATNAIISISNTGYTLTGGVSTTNDAFGRTYVTWNWNAGGSNATNTSGTITSTVRANTTSGFSIVTWAGNSTNAATIGHGLGVAPNLLITKSRSNLTSWVVGIGNISGFGVNDYLSLNSTNGVLSSSTFYQAYGSNTFTVGVSAADEMNKTGNNYVTYCFAQVAGYSAFGRYTGNASTDGPFVFTGMRPRYILIKRTTNADNWFIFDTARNPYNVANLLLYANLSNAEATFTSLDILSNGFKIRTSDAGFNASANDYIYAAFAEFPFKFANAR